MTIASASEPLLVGAVSTQLAMTHPLQVTGTRSTARESPRLLFLASILLGHGLIIYMLLVASGREEAIKEDEYFGLPIYITALTPHRPDAQRQSRNPDRAGDRKGARVESGSAVSELSPPDATSTLPSVDWAKEATDAAQRAAAVNSDGTQFTPIDETRTRPKIEVAPRNERAHRAGVIEMIGPGIERRWISERCFWEFGRPPPLLAGPGPRVNPLHCMVGPREADGHLFDELKPGYLKRKDNP